MPAKVIKRFEDEIQQLKEEQNKAMSLAIFVGMTPAETKETDERRKRIYELYEGPAQAPATNLLESPSTCQQFAVVTPCRLSRGILIAFADKNGPTVVARWANALPYSLCEETILGSLHPHYRNASA